MASETRERGAWAHPALLEIVRGIGYCTYRDDWLPPCRQREGLAGKRDQWCTNCVAMDALLELDRLLKATVTIGAILEQASGLDAKGDEHGLR